ncbi:MAG TPA: LacI family DNA-binding transcriptional regulator [Myxococcota bacterium]|nr:LacI family DNA-binding transcriptional regulator [Myxococcota bacterium]
MKATLHDVAARAEVSIATASRALNGLPVSKTNLVRVRRAAADLGYVANEAARSLRSDRTLTIGLIFPRLRAHAGLELLDAMAGAVEDRGYSLMVSTARGDGERYDLLMRRFLERRVDALICVHPTGSGEMLDAYKAAETPVLAVFDRPGAFKRLPVVLPSLRSAASDLAKSLVALGHQRIALLSRPERIGPISAVCSALKKQGVTLDRLRYGPDPREVRELLRGLLARREPPTAIVTYYRAAVQLMSACRELRIEVPEQLSIVSISDHTAESFPARKPFSALVVEPDPLGRAAGNAVLAWLEGQAPPAETSVEAGTWVERATTANAAR